MTNKEKIISEIQRRISLFRKDGKLGSDTEIALYGLINFINSMQEDPVSDDLEVEFNRFLDEVEGVPRMWHSEEQIEWAMDVARHFAIWQKQQIMKEAIEAYVDQVEYPGSTWIQLSETPKDLKDGDKVKLIIIKEE